MARRLIPVIFQKDYFSKTTHLLKLFLVIVFFTFICLQAYNNAFWGLVTGIAAFVIVPLSSIFIIRLIAFVKCEENHEK